MLTYPKIASKKLCYRRTLKSQNLLKSKSNWVPEFFILFLFFCINISSYSVKFVFFPMQKTVAIFAIAFPLLKYKIIYQGDGKVKKKVKGVREQQ